jgi:nucleoside-diphosphate-sugar epimerase
MAAEACGVQRFFYSSSACVYNIDRQRDPRSAALSERDAYPAMPENGYGWEKLFSERMCQHFHEDFGLPVRIARYHNVYGPFGTFEGGREKAPAAICRKIINAKLCGLSEIEIWGSGTQTRSFQYVDDCVFGTNLLMRSDYSEPVNIGSSESVSIDQMVDVVEAIAKVKLIRRYRPTAPLGVHCRNSDNTLIRTLFGWEPSTRLADGLERTYAWIYDQMAPRYR